MSTFTLLVSKNWNNEFQINNIYHEGISFADKKIKVLLGLCLNYLRIDILVLL